MNTREELLRILRKASADLTVGRSPILVASFLETVLSNNGITVCRDDGDSPVARRWNRVRGRNPALGHLPRYEDMPEHHRSRVSDLFRSLDIGAFDEAKMFNQFVSGLTLAAPDTAPLPPP